MNIVYVSREYGLITGGGIGTYITNVCRAMLERGHNVFLLTDCVNEQNCHKLPEGLVVVPTLQMPEKERGGCFSFNHEYSHRVYKTLLDLCERESIDVIEFAEYCGEGFVSIRSKRLLNTFADQLLVVKCHTPLSFLETINEDKVFHAWVVCDMEMEDYCIRNADKVTSPSQSLADYFAKRVGREDIAICPYPLYLDFSGEPTPMRNRNLKMIRFFGSVQVRKGVDVFIEAALQILERDPEYRFELVGKERNAHFFNRTYSEVLLDMIPECHRDKITFNGEVPYEKVPELLDESAVIVLPSRWENWANACLESMSKGCIVLASSSGGMAEMIQSGENGFVIDPRDPEALAAQILELANGSLDLQLISDAAIQRAKKLTEPVETALRIEANYAKTASKKSGSLSDVTEPRQPLVSVIIPYYNQCNTIQETIESVRASDYANVEIVVVNDGSTSPTARKVFDALEGVVKVDKPNGGLSSARNEGIRRCGGNYFLPLDSDDLIHPQYISKAVAALELNSEIGYLTCYTRNFEALDTPYYPVGYVAKLMPFMNTSGKCTNMYRRSVFDQVGGYDECMNSYEDWDFLISLEAAGIEGDVLPEELFYYRRNYASMVFSVANPIRANLIQYMMEKHRDVWKKDSEMMALLLVRLWKDAEIREEASKYEEFRIYWGKDGALSEKKTKVMSFLKQGETKIECTLPYEPDTNTIRIDFAVSMMTIRLREMEIRDLLNPGKVLKYDGSTLWAGIEVCGTAEVRNRDESNGFVIASTGNDPQLMISDPTIEGSEVQIYFDFEVV